MDQKQPGSPVLRVSIVSGSRNQREHLKRLIEQHGSHVVGMSGFHDYDVTREEPHSDVLLVDLDRTDDTSLTRIEKLIEQSSVPVLFNESTSVPTTPGPYRDDWVDNLVGKLSNLATHRNLLSKSDLMGRPRYAQTTDYALLIVAHSKTRRRVLQIILAAQGIRESTEISFESNFIAEQLEHYGALLVDEHNVSPEEQIIVAELTTQTRVPVQLCNSSTIPYSVLGRRQWGIQLAGKIIKISKFKSISARSAGAVQAPLNPACVPSSDFIAINGEREWGNRLAAVLARVRKNLMEQAVTAKVRRSATPDQALTQQEMKDSTASRTEKDTPVRDKTIVTTSDASYLESPSSPSTSELERFFDFDKELDNVEEYPVLGEGHLLNSAPHDEALAWNFEEETTNLFSNHPTNKNTYERAYNKPRSRWRESLQIIRKKLPKLFH